MKKVMLILAIPFLLAASVFAGDWPAYKMDGARSGVAVEGLSFPLAERWVCEPTQSPRPAWPEPGKELNRTDFDYAFQPVVAGGLVYFGSSADDTVRAVDVKSGEPVWRFTTDGPVRFAPAIAGGKAYVVSDDGFLYCLDAETGELVWRFCAGEGSDRIIGNGRLIARYPCRSGALVVDDVVYVTAGMWPTEGVYVYALDAETGEELWCNDSSGNIYVDLPHAVANGFSGVAPQGYLVASEDVLAGPHGSKCAGGFRSPHGSSVALQAGEDALSRRVVWWRCVVHDSVRGSVFPYEQPISESVGSVHWRGGAVFSGRDDRLFACDR